MKYEIDYEFEEQRDKYEIETDGLMPFPDGCTKDENGLYILPSGKYLPHGAYECEDGSTMIYEPIELRCPWLFLDDDDN